MNNYNICLSDCTTATSLGGVQSLWVLPRKQLSRWWVYTETHNLQYAQILFNKSEKLACYCEILDRTNDAIFTQTQSLTPSRNYAMTLEVKFNQMNLLNRDIFEQMVVDDTLLVCFLDFNDRLWLMGETYGCSVNWNSTTGAFKQNNEDSITFSCTERYPIRECFTPFFEYYIGCEGFQAGRYSSMAALCEAEPTWAQWCNSSLCPFSE